MLTNHFIIYFKPKKKRANHNAFVQQRNLRGIQNSSVKIDVITQFKTYRFEIFYPYHEKVFNSR